MEKRKQVPGLDPVKMVMAILVTAYHCGLMAGCSLSGLVSVVDLAMKMAVPFFFMTSAYLLFYRMEGELAAPANLAKLKAYVLRFLKLYVIWSLVCLPINLYFAVREGDFGPGYPIRYLITFFGNGEQLHTGFMWYMLSSVYASLALLIMLRLRWKERHIYITAAVFYLCSFAVALIKSRAPGLTGVLGRIADVIVLAFWNGKVFSGLGYMAVGFFCARHRFRPKKWQCWLLLGFGALLQLVMNRLGRPIHNGPLPIVFSYAVFVLAEGARWNISENGAKFLRLGSTVVYFVHIPWYVLGGLLLWGFEGYGQYGVVPFLWTIGFSLMTALVVCRFRDRKLIKFLFS